LSPIKGAQDPWEESERTQLTFSGTLRKSNFKTELFAFVADFFCFWPPEPFIHDKNKKNKNIKCMVMRRGY
jgi:hypothetical protein